MRTRRVSDVYASSLNEPNVNVGFSPATENKTALSNYLKYWRATAYFLHNSSQLNNYEMICQIQMPVTHYGYKLFSYTPEKK